MPVDDLNAVHESRMLEQVDQGAIERQSRQLPLSQLTHRDLIDEASVGVLLRIPIVETVDVLDQRDRRAAEALCKEIGAGIGAMRRDTADAGGMLPQGVGRIAVEDDSRRSLHDERQEVTEDLWWRRHHAVGR